MARYTPRWLPLAKAPAFIGATQDDGRIDICNAMADGAISVRVTIDTSSADCGDRVFEGYRWGAQKHLHPDDFDWERSCPREPCYVQGNVGIRLLPIGLLELATEDLVRLFGKPQTGAVTRTDPSSSAPSVKLDEAGCPSDPPVTGEQFGLADDDDVLPLLVQWAAWKYKDRPLPSRETLLADHRSHYGVLAGISQKAMRALRAKLATPAQKLGGAPTQQRYRASKPKTK